VLAGALVVRERRVADRIVPLDLLRTRTVAVAGAAMFLRGLGGAIGAAALGAVFAARIAAGADLGDAVQTVFLVAAPLAALGLLVVLALPESTAD
jgi:hypothetical protein